MKRLIMKKINYSLVFMVLDFNSFQSKFILLKEKNILLHRSRLMIVYEFMWKLILLFGPVQQSTLIYRDVKVYRKMGVAHKNINNRTVKHSQGDSMLCPSCEAVQFCGASASNSAASHSLTTKAKTAVSKPSGTARSAKEKNYCRITAEQKRDL